MNSTFYYLSLMVFLFSCQTNISVEEEEALKGCAADLCETGRPTINEIQDEVAILKEDDQGFILDLHSGFGSRGLRLSCLNEIEVPQTGTYVRFSGQIKQSCDDNGPVVKQNFQDLLLTSLEVIEYKESVDCEPLLINESVEPLSHNTRILKADQEGDCLSMLIQTSGLCDQLKPIDLVVSTRFILFDNMLNAQLKGKTDPECTASTYVLLKFDISPLKQELSTWTDPPKILYFSAQAQHVKLHF